MVRSVRNFVRSMRNVSAKTCLLSAVCSQHVRSVSAFSKKLLRLKGIWYLKIRYLLTKYLPATKKLCPLSAVCPHGVRSVSAILSAVSAVCLQKSVRSPQTCLHCPQTHTYRTSHIITFTKFRWAVKLRVSKWELLSPSGVKFVKKRYMHLCEGVSKSCRGAYVTLMCD
jgi:hypothetical protein